MLRLFVVVCCTASLLLAVPVQQDISQLAKEYAALYPNTDTTPNEEYGEYFQGDIIPHDGEDADDEKTQINPLNAIRDTNRHWPNGLMHYTIQNGVYTTAQIAKIHAGIDDLVRLTRVNGRDCIRILPRNNEANYVSVQHYSGCSSSVGRVGGGQRMSLVDSCVDRHGTIMHEFLHAFGFYHEQSRTDRDDHVTINYSNIQPGTENNFNRYSATVISDLGTPYDYGSVLHYSAYAFAIDPTIPTIITRVPNAPIGQRVTLSRYDIERVQILYRCINPKDTVYFNQYTEEELLALYQ